MLLAARGAVAASLASRSAGCAILCCLFTQMLEEIGCIYHKNIQRRGKPFLFTSRSQIVDGKLDSPGNFIRFCSASYHTVASDKFAVVSRIFTFSDETGYLRILVLKTFSGFTETVF